MKFKRRQIYFFIGLLILVGIGNIASIYYNKNSAYISIKIAHLIKGRYFYINGEKMSIPEKCAINSPADNRGLINDFVCATMPNKLEGVSIHKSSFRFPEDVYKSRPYVEEFSENNDYVHMVLGPKQGHQEKFSTFLLKRQNIMIASDSQNLAKEFVREILQHDFRVENSPL